MNSNPYQLALLRKGKPLFVPFVVLGDPDRKLSVQMIRTLVESGADALELGFPFSDPPADGPVIQVADTRALKAGITVDDCFGILREVRAFTTIPIGLLIYFNLILQRGIEKFYQDCRECGVNSVLVADLPLEHAQEVVPIAKSHRIAPVFLVSEVTTDERMEKIAEIAEGYLYIVSYLGVTGITDVVFGEKIRETIRRARKYSSLPLIVGFGINTPEQVRAVTQAGADGVIVASRIVKEIPNVQKIAEICRAMRASIILPAVEIPEFLFSSSSHDHL
ncbi:MAG: tryptophan synthase subunit alpha [Candidatus Peregrinibacteria bacterium]